MIDPDQLINAPNRVARAAAAILPDPDVGSLDLADTIWLHQFLSGARRLEPKSRSTTEEERHTKVGSSSLPPKTPASMSTDVASIGGGGEVRTPATELRIPVPAAIARTRDLARALHPLARRRPSTTLREVDVDETIRRAADAGEWPSDLVERPIQARWLRVSVVVDTSATAAIWQATARGLVKVLAESGIFAQFRVWFWDTDASIPGVQAVRGIGSLRPARAVHDPGGPHVVLVITDAAGKHWQSHSASRVLANWATAAHVAVLQLLPERLWDQTGFPATETVTVAGIGLAPTNHKLKTTTPKAGPRFPVIALEARSFGRWAGLVGGSPRGPVPAFVFSAEHMPFVKWKLPKGNTDQPDAAATLDTFWAVASPTARRLAGLLAASAPYVSLPVLRLVSRALLPDATNLHEAEVLTGGLLQETARSVDGNPDKLVFQFVPGVRELLTDGVPVETAARSRQSVAAEIDRLSAAMANTMAVAVPEAAGKAEVIAGRSVLKIDADLLQRLRGEPAASSSAAGRKPKQLEWPTLEEVTRVPRWAALALLTRLVRRLRPLFMESLNTDSIPAQEEFDNCLTAVERVACAPGVHAFAQRLEQSMARLQNHGRGLLVRKSSASSDPTRTLLDILTKASEWVVRENMERLRSSSSFVEIIIPVRMMVEDFAKQFKSPQDPINQFLAGLNADFKMVASRHYASNDDDKFPTAFFGPLWPEGMPTGWPPDNQPTSSGLSPARFVLLTEALAAYDLSADMISELEWYGGQLYAGALLVPNSERIDWISAFVNEVTQSGRLNESITALILADPANSRLRSVAEQVAGPLRPPRDFRIRLRVLGSKEDWSDELTPLCRQLGRKLAQAGLGLISGGFQGVDTVVAQSFLESLHVMGVDSDDAIIHFSNESNSAFDLAGRLIKLPTIHSTLDLTLADAVIVIRGGILADGRIEEAIKQFIPVLPLSETGGAAKHFHETILNRTFYETFPPVSKDDVASLRGPLPDAIVSLMNLLDRLFPISEVR